MVDMRLLYSVVVLLAAFILFCTLLLMDDFNLPQPKFQTFVNVTDTSIINANFYAREKSQVETPPFNYLKTAQRGKQNVSLWNRIYGDLNCNDNPRRNVLFALLKSWKEIAKKYELKYALMFGSLIGVVRNNDLIPWDLDIDVLVEYKDILKLQPLGWPRRGLSKLRTPGKTHVNVIPVSEHSKLPDDRFRWDCNFKQVPKLVDKCSIQEPLIRLFNNGGSLDVFDYPDKNNTVEMFTEGKQIIIQKHDYLPLRRCMFMGLEMWCPNNPLKILTDHYGKGVLKPSKKCKNGKWTK